MTAIDEQSPDIAMGVNQSFELQEGGTDEADRIGAGDQGMMFGYACDETSTLMPMPIYLAQRMSERLAAVRKDGTLDYLRPDGKTQVSVRYEDARRSGWRRWSCPRSMPRRSPTTSCAPRSSRTW